MTEPDALQHFINKVSAVLSSSLPEPQLLERIKREMAPLVASDDWLPAEVAAPHPRYYQQYLLHGDALQRFSIVSFVWGPGQQTPIHDHTVWGVIGVLRGAELCQRYRRTEQGLAPDGEAERLERGAVTAVSPSIGDIHRVSNAFADRVSISIHVYGGDIGKQRRHVFDPLTGATKEFVSGYSNLASGT